MLCVCFQVLPFCDAEDQPIGTSQRFAAEFQADLPPRAVPGNPDEVSRINDAAKLAGQNPLGLQKLVHEIFVDIVLLELLSTCKTSQFRIVDGIPIVYCWAGAHLESFCSKFLLVPKPFRPVCQPMGDAVKVEQLRQNDAFVAVLDPAPPSETWQTWPKNLSVFDGIKRLKEGWMPSPEQDASDPCHEDVVKVLLTVDNPMAISSSNGVFYLTNSREVNRVELLKYGLDSKGLMLYSWPVPTHQFYWLKVAVAGDNFVALDQDGRIWIPALTLHHCICYSTPQEPLPWLTLVSSSLIRATIGSFAWI